MQSGDVDQVRVCLAIWEVRVKQDEEALAVAERHLADIQERLASSSRSAQTLRAALQRWETVTAKSSPDNQ